MPLPEAREYEQTSPSAHAESVAPPSSTGLARDAAQHPAATSDTTHFDDPPPAPGKRSWLRIAIVSLVILAAVAFVVYRIRTNKKADQKQAGTAAAAANRPVPVAFNTVLQRPVPIYLTALGTVTAYNTVTVKSRVDGEITRINFREGQRVTAGQLLMEIDPRPYQATLSQAQGNFVRDQANAAFAQAQAQRYNQLYTAGVVSKESTQTQQATAGQASGTLAADQATIQSARVNLNYTRITSPITGVVGLRQVDIGNVIAANSSTGLLLITQVEPIAVIFTLPEDQLPQVFQHMKGGRKLTVEAWDRGDLSRIATGQLLTVDNQIDTTTGTAKLKAVFDNHDGALFPNQFVNIRLVLENRTNAITVPAAALQTGNGNSFVYVIDMQHPISPDQTARAASAGSGTQGSAANNNGTASGSGTRVSGGAAAQGGGGTASNGGTAASGSGSGSSGSGSSGGGSTGAAGANSSMRQTSYPVHARPVAVDLTQGTTVIIGNGLQPGEKVVTDGQEKLKDGSKVIPHPAAQVDGPAVSNGSTNAPDINNPHGRHGTNAPRRSGGTMGLSTKNAAKGGQSSRQGNAAGASKQQ